MHSNLKQLNALALERYEAAERAKQAGIGKFPPTGYTVAFYPNAERGRAWRGEQLQGSWRGEPRAEYKQAMADCEQHAASGAQS